MIWFLASLASLLLFTWAGAKWQMRSLGQGVRMANGAWRSVWNVPQQRGRAWSQLAVAVSVPSPLEFEIRPENAASRLAGALRLGTDLATGDARLDRSLHVVADDARLREVLDREPGLAGDLQALIDQPAPGFRLVRLACRGGVLRLDLAGRVGEWPLERVADNAFARVRSIAAALPDGPVPGGPSAGFRHAAWLKALAFALLANAALQWPRVAFLDSAHVVDGDRLQALGLAVALLLLAGMAGATLLLRASSGRWVRTMATVLLVGGMGAWAHGPLLLRDANIALDFAAPQVVRGEVSMGTTALRRSQAIGVSFGQLPGEIVHRAPGDETFAWRQGMPLQAELHPGALGLRWVDRIEAASSP